MFERLKLKAKIKRMKCEEQERILKTLQDLDPSSEEYKNISSMLSEEKPTKAKEAIITASIAAVATIIATAMKCLVFDRDGDRAFLIESDPESYISSSYAKNAFNRKSDVLNK